MTRRHPEFEPGEAVAEAGSKSEVANAVIYRNNLKNREFSEELP